MKKLIYITAVILLLASCSKEVVVSKFENEQEQFEATFTVELPSGTFGATKAMSNLSENHVESVDVLVFRESGGEEYFFYRSQTTLVDTDSGDSKKKKFSISVKPSTDKQRYVVLVNAKEPVDALGVIPSTHTKENVLKKIVLRNSAEWDATSPTVFTPIPMWGESDFVTITDRSSAAVSDIKLIRSLAKINVKIVEAAQSTFKMSEVRLYNSSNRGMVAPMAANWDETLLVVSHASLPEHSVGDPIVNTVPLAYTTMTTPHKELVNTIYTFEAKGALTAAGATCLLIKGRYGSDSDDTYYRLDFMDGTNFMDILRNHLYDVEIREVHGRGYSSDTEALQSSFSYISASVNVWNQGEMADIVYDHKNMLAVTSKQFELYNEEVNESVKVNTTCSDWTAAVTQGAGWLSITDAPGTGLGVTSELKFKVLANATGETRTGGIKITAGRLEQAISIKQHYTGVIELNVGDVEMTFPSAIGGSVVAQNLLIDWLPVAQNCQLELADIAGYEPIRGYTPPASISGGEQVLSISPDAMLPADIVGKPFAELRSQLKAKVTNVSGQSIEKLITLRQVNYALTVGGRQPQDEYDLGTSYTFNIKTNALWELSVSDPDGIISDLSQTAGGPNTQTGHNIVLKTTSLASKAGKSATLTFKSKESGVFQDIVVPIKIHDMVANCHIIPPNGIATIKVKTAYKTWAEDVDLRTVANPFAGAITVDQLWEDEPNLIQSVTISGTGENATITVKAQGGKSGNAVVCIKSGGVIRWSWHIWVTDYNPEVTNKNVSGYVLMDRNLGARNTTPGDVGSYGLLYQHGRKDPFPGAATVNASGNNSKRIYYKGTMLDSESTDPSKNGVRRLPVGAAMNLVNAFMNPLVHYNGVTDAGLTIQEYNWYTNNNGASAHRYYLWGGIYKTVFDPCPKGWKMIDASLRILGNEIPSTFEINKGGTLSQAGFFPASGIRHRSGGLRNMGTMSSIWLINSLTTNNFGYAYAIRYSSDYFLHTTVGGIFRDEGYAARCMRVE